MKIFILLCLLPLPLFADNARTQFCESKQNHRTLQKGITQRENLISFNNTGGIGNAGTCWWHSRLQRNSHYLTLFQPDQPKKENRYYKGLIRRMVKGKQVVKIPGYKNLNQFTRVYKDYFQRQLNKWQLKDGIIKFAWVKGLKGKTETSATQLKSMMNKLFNLVEKQKTLTYTKLQLKGITAHAWLVYKMTPTNNGYLISYIDSNWSQSPRTYRYSHGDRSLHVYGNGLIYPEKAQEFKKLKKVVKSYCAN